MMSQCRVPNWNLRHQRQGQEEAEEGNRSSQIHNHNHQHNPSHVFPMSNYEVAELTWENGQLAMHGLGVGGLLSNTPTKPTWGRACDTLESIVNQATTCTKQRQSSSSLNFLQLDCTSTTPNISSGIAFTSSGDHQISGNVQRSTPTMTTRSFEKKRTRSEYSDQWGGRSLMQQDERAVLPDNSACGSATAATFCRDNHENNNNNTMMTWPSFESPPPSLKTKTTDEDSANCHGGSENQDEDRETKGETGRSHSRRSRAAAIHNQSERRRRDRINQKMKALQKLVPNASKTDKASMLDEVIAYLKQLQAQVHMMTSVRNMPPPQMMMPLGMQQQIQMSLLARMGMGLGMGMGMGQSLSPLVHPNTATTSTFVQPPPFMVPPPMVSQVPQSNSDAATRTSVPFNDPYCAFLAQQSMNMDLYNKMAVLYRQQVNQTSPSQSNHVQGD